MDTQQQGNLDSQSLSDAIDPDFVYRITVSDGKSLFLIDNDAPQHEQAAVVDGLRSALFPVVASVRELPSHWKYALLLDIGNATLELVFYGLEQDTVVFTANGKTFESKNGRAIREFLTNGHWRHICRVSAGTIGVVGSKN